MGICPIKRTYKIVHTQDTHDPFVLCRGSLVEQLKRLHKLQLEYRLSIDDCILKQDLFTALNLKLKQLKLKDLSDVLQSQIKRLDDEGSNLQTSVLREKFVGEVMAEVASEKSQIFPLSPRTSKIPKASDEEFEVPNCDISKEPQERQDLVHEELNYQIKRLESLNEGASYNRKTYIQGH